MWTHPLPGGKGWWREGGRACLSWGLLTRRACLAPEACPAFHGEKPAARSDRPPMQVHRLSDGRHQPAVERPRARLRRINRKSVEKGRSVTERVELGGRRTR